MKKLIFFGFWKIPKNISDFFRSQKKVFFRSWKKVGYSFDVKKWDLSIADGFRAIRAILDHVYILYSSEPRILFTAPGFKITVFIYAYTHGVCICTILRKKCVYAQLCIFTFEKWIYTLLLKRHISGSEIQNFSLLSLFWTFFEPLKTGLSNVKRHIFGPKLRQRDICLNRNLEVQAAKQGQMSNPKARAMDTQTSYIIHVTHMVFWGLYTIGPSGN